VGRWPGGPEDGGPVVLRGRGLVGLQAGSGLVVWMAVARAGGSPAVLWFGGQVGWQVDGGCMGMSARLFFQCIMMFSVLKFQLCLLLYFSQECLQCLSKVPDSWGSHSLCLCPRITILDPPATGFVSPF
jgi:hypothetical protein